VAKPFGLVPRKGWWTIRIRGPVELVSILGKGEVGHSLRRQEYLPGNGSGPTPPLHEPLLDEGLVVRSSSNGGGRLTVFVAPRFRQAFRAMG